MQPAGCNKEQAFVLCRSLGNLYPTWKCLLFSEFKHMKCHKHSTKLFNMRENMLQIFLTIGLFDNDNTKVYQHRSCSSSYNSLRGIHSIHPSSPVNILLRSLIKPHSIFPLCSMMFTSVQQCSIAFNSVQQCSTVCNSVQKCSIVFNSAYQ